MRRHFLLSIRLACLLSAAACTSVGPSDPDTSIVFWSSNNGGEIAFSRWAVDRWNRTHPDRPVQYQPILEGQSSEEIILAAVVGGTTPDIYANLWQGLAEFYGRSGVLVPLDTLDGFLDFLRQRCDEETIREVTADDGHIYQVPWKINPFMTIYNVRLLQSVGLDTFPATYPDFLAAAERFQADTDGDGYVDRWFGNTSVKLAWYQRLFNFYPLYLAASGGLPLVRDGRAQFNNPYGVGVFRFLQELYRRNYFSRQYESAGQDLFIGGRYASKWTGPWEIEYLEKFLRPGFRYEFAPMPVPAGHAGPVYTYCDPKNIVIFNTCRRPQAAWEFIRSMIDEEGDRQLLALAGQLPRRQGLDTLPAFRSFFEENPRMQAFAQQARYVRGVDNCVSMVEVLDILSQEYEACVLYGIKTPEAAIADAERAVNILLAADADR